jgi:hypothetical protein
MAPAVGIAVKQTAAIKNAIKYCFIETIWHVKFLKVMIVEQFMMRFW